MDIATDTPIAVPRLRCRLNSAAPSVRIEGSNVTNASTWIGLNRNPIAAPCITAVEHQLQGTDPDRQHAEPESVEAQRPDAIFEGSMLQLHQDGLLDISVIHGDGTTTAAKKGGDNIGFNGHKKLKSDKVVAFGDRNCNVIAPLEAPLLREALPGVTRIIRAIAMDLQGSIVSLDGRLRLSG